MRVWAFGLLSVLCLTQRLIALGHLPRDSGSTNPDRQTPSALLAISGLRAYASSPRRWPLWDALRPLRRQHRQMLEDTPVHWWHRVLPPRRHPIAKLQRTLECGREQWTYMLWTKVCAPAPGVRTSSARSCAPSENMPVPLSTVPCLHPYDWVHYTCHGVPVLKLFPEWYSFLVNPKDSPTRPRLRCQVRALHRLRAALCLRRVRRAGDIGVLPCVFGFNSRCNPCPLGYSLQPSQCQFAAWPPLTRSCTACLALQPLAPQPVMDSPARPARRPASPASLQIAHCRKYIAYPGSGLLDSSASVGDGIVAWLVVRRIGREPSPTVLPLDMAWRRKRPRDQVRNRERPTQSRRRAEEHAGDDEVAVNISSDSDVPQAASSSRGRPITAYGAPSGDASPHAIQEALDHDKLRQDLPPDQFMQLERRLGRPYTQTRTVTPEPEPEVDLGLRPVGSGPEGDASLSVSALQMVGPVVFFGLHAPPWNVYQRLLYHLLVRARLLPSRLVIFSGPLPKFVADFRASQSDLTPPSGLRLSSVWFPWSMRNVLRRLPDWRNDWLCMALLRS